MDFSILGASQRRGKHEGGPAQSGPRSTAFSILGASHRRGMHEGREYRGRGRTSSLGAR